MNPIPILFVDHATALGGAEQSLLLLLQQLDRRQWQPHLACPAGKLAERAQQAGVDCHLLPLPRLRRSWRLAQDGYQTSRALADISRQIGAQALYANTVRAAFYTAVAARLARRPFVWHMRDFWLSEQKPARLWLDTAGKWLLAAGARQVIANSTAVAAHLPQPDKTGVVHNGIDLAHFAQPVDGRAFRQQYNIPAEAPLVGMVGRLRPWKGQTAFLQMAAMVQAQQPASYFVIVGGANFAVEHDDYPQQLAQMAQQVGLGERVIFTGALADVRPSLAAMDLFVHPGEPEPFGLVNIEAMAMGKPVVAFGHGALPEIVVHEQTGLLCPAGDVQGLATAVLSLLADGAARQKMGVNGRERVQTRFTIQQTATAVAELLQKVVA